MNSKNRTVFITGAGGFIGANLTRSLIKNDYNVYILSHTTNLSWRLKDISNLITVHIGDITSFKSLEQALQKTKPDYIIHLATYGAYHYQTDLKKIIKVNIEGTENLLEASRNISYKCFINTGSSSEYGRKDKPMRENDFCDPVSYYGLTKLATTHLCKVFAQINDKPIVTLRLFSAYGPFEEPTRFIPTVARSIILKKTINLTPENQRHDFIYTDDVSNAYLHALQKGLKIKGKTLNIGTGKEYTNDEIIQKLFKVTNKKTRVKKGAYTKRTWDSSHWVADISYAKKMLEWKPAYTIDKGLHTAYSWFEENIKFYK